MTSLCVEGACSHSGMGRPSRTSRDAVHLAKRQAQERAYSLCPEPLASVARVNYDVLYVANLRSGRMVTSDAGASDKGREGEPSCQGEPGIPCCRCV